MYKLNDYLRVRLPDGQIIIGRVHTITPLTIQSIGGHQLYFDFEVVEQLSPQEVAQLFV